MESSYAKRQLNNFIFDQIQVVETQLKVKCYLSPLLTATITGDQNNNIFMCTQFCHNVMKIHLYYTIRQIENTKLMLVAFQFVLERCCFAGKRPKKSFLGRIHYLAEFLNLCHGTTHTHDYFKIKTKYYSKSKA